MATTSRKVKDSPAAEKPVSRKVKSDKVTKIVQYMTRFSKDTPGTLRFEAVDKNGKVLQQADSEINQLYCRRSSPAMQNDPRYLKIEVTVLDAPPGSDDE